MAITPLPGFILDPNNSNGVIRDPNVATLPGGYTPSTQPTSTAFGAVNTQPIVTPNPSGNLQNTLTTPTPPTTAAPASTNGAPQGQTPSGTTSSTAAGAGLDPTAFTSVLEGIKNNYAASNALIDSKNLLLKGLFTSPLTPDEIAKLPPDIAQVYNSGNKDAIELQLQALNGQIQGGTNNFSQSVNYLVNGYQTSVQQAEQQKQDAISNVQNFVQQYGSKAGAALTSLYGPGYVDTLKNMGINIDQFAATPTLAESAASAKSSSSGSGGGSSYDESDPTVQAYSQGILSGNITSIASVPAQYRDAVALALTDADTAQYSPLASSRYTLAANRIESNFLKLPQYELTANGLPYLQRIDAAEKTPGSISDQDLLDSLTKLNTAGNAISDAQVKLVTDGQSFSDWANVLSNKFKNGGVLSNSQRQQIQSIAKSIYANYAKGYQPVYDQVASQLTAAGIPKAFWTIPDLNDLAEKGGLSPSGSETSNSSLPPDVQATLAKNITISPDGKTAYLPRSVWSTLGPNMDAVLTEAKNDGYTLLIQ